MLRASNQEPPGRHVTREHQWGATVPLLVRPRKVGVTQKGDSRGQAGGKRAKAHVAAPRAIFYQVYWETTRRGVRHYTKVSKGYQSSVHKGCTMKQF